MNLLELKVLTLNVWGIPYVSSDKETRISAIANQLSIGNYDIVALQEVWSEADFQIIQQENESVLPYSHYFYSGVFGAGLCIFSKYPIVATIFHSWPVNGYFHKFQHGDWFGGKGVALCRILIKNQIVNVYNTHLHAEYDPKNDDYKTHRAIQAFHTAQFIQATRGKAVLQILAGDLNSQPDEVSYKTILHTSKMNDCCPYEDIGTNECIRNSYSTTEAIKKNPVGLRIDHIFARAFKKYTVFVDEYKLPFPERIPGYKFSYSDHEAVCVKICVTEKSKNKEIDSEGDDLEKCRLEWRKENEFVTADILKECINLCEKSIKKLRTDRMFYYSITTFIIFLLVILVDFRVPYGFRTLYLFSKFILFGIALFSLFMATIWNHMERNGIRSAKHSMEIALKSLHDYPIFQE
ncbi:putative neutral sphingomyelinase [Condylostylus longicornis]|uniref:putative neutral sphingomyelinase n=1 Tax=Condylostylus longicornis TaxID=2530218 RepID=UPI00244DD4B2|nr:putative neutral sphingomyelinase [Condylostylus longicornis]